MQTMWFFLATQATVHWVAPEVLNEKADIDYSLADVYSYGTTHPAHVKNLKAGFFLR